MNRDRLREVIEYLRSGAEYDGRINELLMSLGTETDYQERYDEVSEKEIGEMSLDDLRTMYTFISRGERFCDGHIQSYIEDGTLLRLAERQMEIT